MKFILPPLVLVFVGCGFTVRQAGRTEHHVTHQVTVDTEAIQELCAQAINPPKCVQSVIDILVTAAADADD